MIFVLFLEDKASRLRNTEETSWREERSIKKDGEILLSLGFKNLANCFSSSIPMKHHLSSL